MILKVKTSTIYECSLERAFKTPILCDVTKVHTGYGITPRVTHTSDDENWGQVGSSKKVFVEKSLTKSGGFAFMDRVLERKENEYWKIQVDDFQFWMPGFFKFVGEWKTTEIGKREILVEYEYSLFSNKAIFYPLNWLFAKLYWKSYMKRVLNNIKAMSYDEEPYQYD